MSLARRGFAFACLLVVAIAAIFPIQSSDLFMNLALGRRLLDTGTLPARDPFVFAGSGEWQVWHEWAVHGLFEIAYRLAGWAGPTLLKALAVTGAAASVFWAGRRAPFLAAGFVVLAANASSFRWIERASMVSDLCIPWVAALAIAGPLPVWLPLLFVAWMQCHPGALFGLAIIAIVRGPAWITSFRRGSSAPERREWLTFALCILALFVTPGGWRTTFFPLTLTLTHGDYLRATYVEWMPLLSKPLLTMAPGTLIAFGALVVATLICLLKSRTRRPWALCLFVTIAALAANRLAPAAAWTLAVVGAHATRERALSSERLQQGMFLAFVFAVLLVIAGYPSPSGWRRFGFGLDTRLHPIAAVKALEFDSRFTNETRVYNAHDFGAYLAWKWNGSPPVLFHGFVLDRDFYLNELLPSRRSAKAFEAMVEKYQIRALLLDPQESAPAFLEWLRANPRWELTHRDAGALVVWRRY